MRTLRYLSILTLACAALAPERRVGAAPAAAAVAATCLANSKVQQHDMQLRQMQPAQADAWNQLQTLRQEVNTLKGQLDDIIQNAGGAHALVARVRAHDEALRQVERSMALNLNLGDPMSSGGSSGSTAQYTPQAAPQAAPQVAPAFSQSPLGQPSYGQPTYGQQLCLRAGGCWWHGCRFRWLCSGICCWRSGRSVKPASGCHKPQLQHMGPAQPQPEPQVQAPKKDISLALFDAGVNSVPSKKV